jgi:DNA-directed RNA polymerase specialized sigma24 family protein
VEARQLDVSAQVRQARGGDRSAQELLARRVYEVGLRLAAFPLGDRDLAQDVGQEAAIRVLRSIGRLRDPARFDAWAFWIGPAGASVGCPPYVRGVLDASGL